MKKIIILLAVLSLMAGVAYAADLNDGETRQVYAQARGRNVVSGTCVLARFWYNGTGAGPAVGVSANTSITLYSNIGAGTVDTTFTTSNANSNTVGEIVASANSVTGWHAKAGPDGYDSQSTNGTLLSGAGNNYGIPGLDESNSIPLYMDSTLSRKLICGVNPTEGKISRIKSVVHKVSGTGDVVLRIRQGDTTVYRKDITAAAYNTTGGADCSPDTVYFSFTDLKGIAGDVGKPLCVEVERDLTQGEFSCPISHSTVSIIYDQF